jgi:hypothetical protein
MVSCRADSPHRRQCHDTSCRWVRAERAEVQQASPDADAVAAEIADLEALIEARPARAPTLRPLVEELRTKQANLQRANLRKAQSLKGAEIAAEESYKAAVAELAATLEGSNLEAETSVRALSPILPMVCSLAGIFFVARKSGIRRLSQTIARCDLADTFVLYINTVSVRLTTLRIDGMYKLPYKGPAG